jgi:pimeloyl-ACP methyl ester carboxylesterase
MAILAGAALANHLAARRAERRHPPAGKFLTVDGVRLHYIEMGQGPPYVLIHGNGVSSSDFVLSGLFDRLAQNHRVIAFDRPGFGYSQRPRARIWTAKAQAALIMAALDALDVRRPVIVAHSWGTLVAVRAALKDPAKIAGLVVMSGYYRPTPRLDALVLGAPSVPILGDVIRYTLSPPLGWLMKPLVFRQLFSPRKCSERFRRGFETSMSLRPSQLRATAGDTALMPLEAARINPHLGELETPVLVITGAGDKIVSSKHQSEHLLRELQDGELHVVEGAGHMVHHSAPDEVATAMERFEHRVRPPGGANAAQGEAVNHGSPAVEAVQ